MIAAFVDAYEKESGQKVDRALLIEVCHIQRDRRVLGYQWHCKYDVRAQGMKDFLMHWVDEVKQGKWDMTSVI